MTKKVERSLDAPPGVHINTEYNNADTPFDFTPASYKEIFETLAKYPPQNKQSGILPLLHLTQRQCGGEIEIFANITEKEKKRENTRGGKKTNKRTRKLKKKKNQDGFLWPP